jgi:hypothetical protein
MLLRRRIVDAERLVFVAGHLQMNPGDPILGIVADDCQTGVGPLFVHGDCQSFGESAFD